MGNVPNGTKLPPEIKKALVRAWAVILLADLKRNPPAHLYPADAPVQKAA